jgi:nitronate monooxygenase
MKDAGAAAGDHHRMQLWAGQSAALARPMPAAGIVAAMWRDAQELLA